AKAVYQEARARETAAMAGEVFGLGQIAVSDGESPGGHTKAAIRALIHRLEADRKTASAARVQAQDALAAAKDRLAAQTQAVPAASDARSAAESAIENELGRDAVRSPPDGITATLVGEQAGQPDPVAIGGIGQPIPGAALASPFGLRNDPLSGGAGFHPGV